MSKTSSISTDLIIHDGSVHSICYQDADHLVFQLDGRIVQQNLDTGLIKTLVPRGKARGSVGYGGISFDIKRDLLVYTGKDSRVHLLNLVTGDQVPLTGPYSEGLAQPVIHPVHDEVWFIHEAAGTCSITRVAMDGEGRSQTVHAGAWYAFNPTFSGDGSFVAWHEWGQNDMSWQKSWLEWRRLDPDDSGRVVDSGRLRPKDAAVTMPVFRPGSHELYFFCDQNGRRALYASDLDRSGSGEQPVPKQAVHASQGEFGMPDWVCGQHSLAFSPNGEIAMVIETVADRQQLLRFDLASKSATYLATDLTRIEEVSVGPKTCAIVASGARVPTQLQTLSHDLTITNTRVNTQAYECSSQLRASESVSWSAPDGTPVFGVLTKADSKGEPCGLIVHIHGGPTGQSSLGWDSQAQVFAAHGWHYLSVNHRGSSGCGRTFQESLNGHWGIYDVEDAAGGASCLVDQNIADPKRLVITGGSAGGYTTALSLALKPDFWAAGISRYGLADMYDSLAKTHRFESSYGNSLIGKLPEAGPVWKERSPRTHAHKITAPLLWFHGDEDKAVPIDQAKAFCQHLIRTGKVCEFVVLPGEGHGFRRPVHKKQVIETSLAFLEKYVNCRQG